MKPGFSRFLSTSQLQLRLLTFIPGKVPNYSAEKDLNISIHAGSPNSQEYNQSRHNRHSNLLHPKRA